MEAIYINLSKLRNNEHFQFFTEFDKAMRQFGGADNLRLKQEQGDLFATLYAQEDETLKKILKSAFTEEIQIADQYRDQLFRGMADAVKSALNHFSPDVRTTAKRLKILFDTYGNLAALPINEETSAIYNLLQDLSGNYYSDAQQLNLTDWIGELQAANDTVGQLVFVRFEEDASKTGFVLKQVRSQMDELYKGIVRRIESFAEIDPDGTPFIPFLNLLNSIIEKYNNLMAQRYGRKENAKKS